MVATSQLAEDFIQYVEKVRGFSPSTVRTYRYVLQCFLVELAGRDLTEQTIYDMDNLISKFVTTRGLKPSSANTVRCVLRAFFAYIERYRDIRLSFDYAMIRQQKAPRARIKFVTPEKALRIISHLETPQDKLMVITLFATGMRIGEIIKFNVEDFHDNEITIRGKGGKNRVVPIDNELGELLTGYIYENKILTGPIFRHQDPKNHRAQNAYTPQGIRMRLQRQLKPHDLYIKPHAFRHGIATSLLTAGMDIRTLQTFLGHTHIATTMLYTHVTDKHLRDAYQQFSPIREMDLTKVLDTAG